MSLSLAQLRLLTDWSNQDKNLRNCCNARGLLILRTKSAEHVCASLPKRSHNDDPTEAVAIDQGLGEMCNSEDTEEDGEDYRSGEAGRVLPEGIASLCGHVAVGGGSCV